MGTPKSKYQPLIVNILSGIAGSIVALFGVWITVGSNQNIAETHLLSETTSTLFQRIESLEKQLETQRKIDAQSQLLISQLQVENVALKSKIIDQFDQMGALYSFFQYMPGPAWMKNPEGVMIWINKAYEKTYGISKLRYEGSTDFEVWPEEVAQQFRDNDLTVLAKKEPITVTETINGEDWVIWKFPVVLDGQIIGIGGVAIPMSELLN